MGGSEREDASLKLLVSQEAHNDRTTMEDYLNRQTNVRFPDSFKVVPSVRKNRG